VAHKLFRLAWRNIWRNTNRSLMTAGAVGVVVVITTAFFSLVGAVQNGLYVSLTRITGHLQIHVTDYRQIRRWQDLLIEDAEAVENRLVDAFKKAPVELVSALAVPGLIESEGRSYGILLQGLEQPSAARERYAGEYLAAGSLPELGDVTGIALGEKLAQNLQVDLGDTVYLYTPGTEGYGASAYIVTGILTVPSSEATAVSSLLAAQELAAPEAINRIELTFPNLTRTGDDADLYALAESARAGLGPDYQVEAWSTVSPGLASILGLFGTVSLFLAAIFFILAGMLVANTVYLSVIERVREFGVLRALGITPREVVLMIVQESVLLCFTGALAGLLVGTLLAGLMAQGFSAPGEIADFLAERGFPRIFYGSVSNRQVAITVGFTFVTATLAALFPALNAGRLEPAEAMRFTA
jgi:ABC-type lipoprotein release transport system permease subunit